MPLTLAAVTLGGIASAIAAVRSRGSAQRARTSGSLLAFDTLVYLLALNLVFFAQEVGLVLTKALLPGVQSTLFHNSHDWTGTHPDLDYWQLAGAFSAGMLALAALTFVQRPRDSFGGLLSRWLVFHGAVTFLVSVASGAVDTESEMGRGLAALGVAGWSAVVVGITAIAALPVVLTRIGTTFQAGRTIDVIRRLLVPAVLGVPLVVIFRLPELSQGIAGLLILAIGLPWLLIGAQGPSVATEQQASALPSSLPKALAYSGLSVMVALILTTGPTFG